MRADTATERKKKVYEMKPLVLSPPTKRARETVIYPGGNPEEKRRENTERGEQNPTNRLTGKCDKKGE